MPSIDMQLEQMRLYRPALTRQPDFELYWKKTIAEAIAQPLNVELIPYVHRETQLKLVVEELKP